ncbi:endonuclease V [Mameliella alba]|nr:endonuclease V [Antarctobacter heliothermus]MBY6146196.1 endonuclease V [Mameliella alba]MCA0955381.1 endonuclease V [Mameliella alba]
MILACDVHYNKDLSAVAAGVAFDHWAAARAQADYVTRVATIAPYEPGAFYKRELPCLLALLDIVPKQPDVILIDGFVTLGAEARPGLGARLFAALNKKASVIGVAKSPFRGTPPECALLRGSGKTPLYISAAGLPLDRAKAHVAEMHGAHRIPTLLSAVDHLCRNAGLP